MFLSITVFHLCYGFIELEPLSKQSATYSIHDDHGSFNQRVDI